MERNTESYCIGHEANFILLAIYCSVITLKAATKKRKKKDLKKSKLSVFKIYFTLQLFFRFKCLYKD